MQQVINSLTDAMLNRRLRPGDKIPTETELAETLGVGRNSIREAIKILVYLGVLEIRRAEGTFVCEGFSEGMIDPMIYGIILDALTREEAEALTKEEREWIVSRDQRAAAAAKDSGGSMESLEYRNSLCASTRERVYELGRRYSGLLSGY